MNKSKEHNESKKACRKKVSDSNNFFLFVLSFVLILILFSSIPFVYAQTPNLPTEFYGMARSFNQQAVIGSVITVHDSEGNICGSFKIKTNGYFGVLTCRAGDSENPGPEENELLTFKINNQVASTAILTGYTRTLPNATNSTKYGIYNRSEVTWQSGYFKDIIVVVPPLVCGDSFCDSLENCNTCTLDCGVCPIIINPPSNGTGGTGGGAGGGGGDSGSFNGGEQVEGDSAIEEPTFCEESWLCGDWQKCLPTNIQIRECTDVNDCGTSDAMPDIAQDCIYPVDEIPEEYVPQNGTSSIPRIETPGIISTCKERLSIYSLPSLLFIGLLFIVIVISEFDYRRKLKRIINDKSLDELKKLELKYIEERKKYIFLIVIIVIALIVYFYHYFFLLCQDKYIRHLWLLLLGIILLPIIVHVFLALSRFSEKQKNKHLQILNDAHYKHVIAMMNIANDQLVSSEKRIVAKIYALEEREEFNKLINNNKIVAKIYLDMTKLFNLYKTLNNPMNVEKDLLENIKKFNEDKEFIDASKVHSELESLRSGLGMLYSAYELKQGLYDELSKIEEEYGIKEDVVR